ncbi:MAG: NADH-quinone oxidoreductase subunit J [Deltaproteobacteria bacterium]|nr:NADH-quinone oxidoreductase subunit J [Deltaproteobacteria bacterium]
MDISIGTIIFYLIAAITVVSAAVVVFSSNIVHSAFSLVGTFGGVAGIYVLLGADFVAAVQILIYVGGIVVIILFAVMLTHRIADVQVTNRSVGKIPALIVTGLVITLLVSTILESSWNKADQVAHDPTTAQIGELFLTDYLLPFELASIVLLVALIGAVTLSRKEIKE